MFLQLDFAGDLPPSCISIFPCLKHPKKSMMSSKNKEEKNPKKKTQRYNSKTTQLGSKKDRTGMGEIQCPSRGRSLPI
jgi:hypothetical protein